MGQKWLVLKAYHWRPPSCKILISSQPIDQFWRSLACWCVSTFFTPIANRISLFQKIQDGSGDHFENSTNCNISTTTRPILVTFSTMMSLGLPATVCQWNFTNLKIQDGGVHHFEKLKNLNIFVTDWPFCQNLTCSWVLIVWTPLAKKFGDFKNKRWWRRPSGKLKNCNISALDIPVLEKKIWHGDVSRSSKPHQHIKFYAFKNSTWWPIAIWKI